MIRVRFKANPGDGRPVAWPIKHPYWITGYGDDYSTIVAYADDEAEVLRLWPEAYDIDAEQAVDYLFTARFPKPIWFDGPQPPV